MKLLEFLITLAAQPGGRALIQKARGKRAHDYERIKTLLKYAEQIDSILEESGHEISITKNNDNEPS